MYVFLKTHVYSTYVLGYLNVILNVDITHMGLGKTLQSLCIIAGDHYYRTQDYKVSSYKLQYTYVHNV